MERKDVKRLRMEIEIVERVHQRLPLTHDAMTYLLNYFDLRSLNRMSRTSGMMQEFFTQNQIWRRKFLKLLLEVPNDDIYDTMNTIPTERWIPYWDMLANGHCPVQYRLLIAFLFVFRNQNSESEITLFRNNLSINFSTEFHTIGNASFPIVHARNLFPAINGEGIEEDDDKSVSEFLSQITKLNWEFSYDHNTSSDTLGDMIFEIPIYIWSDAVTVVYQLLSLGFNLPEFAEYASIETKIECAQCEMPAPKTVCSSCKTTLYCNQECADAHWNLHQCNQ